MTEPLRWTLPAVEDGREAFLLGATALLLGIVGFVIFPGRAGIVLVAVLALALLLFLAVPRWATFDGDRFEWGRGRYRFGGFDLRNAARVTIRRDRLFAAMPPLGGRDIALPNEPEARARIVARAAELFPSFDPPAPPGLPIHWSVSGRKPNLALVWTIRIVGIAAVLLALYRREYFAMALPLFIVSGTDDRPRELRFALTYASATRPYALGRWSMDWPHVRRAEFHADRIVLHASARETIWNCGGGLVLQLPPDPTLRAEIEATVRAKIPRAHG